MIARVRGAVVLILLGALCGLATRCAPFDPGLPRCPAGRPAHERCEP